MLKPVSRNTKFRETRTFFREIRNSFRIKFSRISYERNSSVNPSGMWHFSFNTGDTVVGPLRIGAKRRGSRVLDPLKHVIHSILSPLTCSPTYVLIWTTSVPFHIVYPTFSFHCIHLWKLNDCKILLKHIIIFFKTNYATYLYFS